MTNYRHALLFWANETDIISKYKDFWMGPSVKFVSRINGSFSKKNMGQLFSLVKKTKPEGGVRGVFGKRPDFFRFFPGPLPLAILAILVNLENLVNMK